MSFLSVIIPVYNAEMYLEETLPALKAQLSPDMEVVLVDDGSTDRSPEICRNFAEKTAQTRFVSQANAGPNAARNRGMREASGEYLTFLDADDGYEPGTLRNIAGFLRKEPADLLLMPVRQILLDGRKKKNKREEFPLQKMSGKELRAFWAFGNPRVPGYLCGKVFARERLQNITLPEEMRFAEDMYALSDIFLNIETAVLIPFGGYRYMEHPGTPTSGKWTVEKSRQLQSAYLHRWEVAKHIRQPLKEQLSAWGLAIALYRSEVKLFPDADFSEMRDNLKNGNYSVIDILLEGCSLRRIAGLLRNRKFLSKKGNIS